MIKQKAQKIEKMINDSKKLSLELWQQVQKMKIAEMKNKKYDCKKCKSYYDAEKKLISDVISSIRTAHEKIGQVVEILDEL
jgi:hypothetical protein